MDEYYILTQDLTQERGIVEVEANIVVANDQLWVEGNRFITSIPHQKMQIDTQYGDRLSDFFDTTVPLMSQRLVEILVNSGADNIDTYPMTLRWPDGRDEPTPYFAVNVVGCLDAIDLEKSDYEEDILVLRFRKLVVDPLKTKGLKCFRLNDLENYIVVAASVAEAILVAALTAVQVTPVRNYRDRLLL